MSNRQARRRASAYSAKLEKRVAWIITGNYPEPPQEEKPIIRLMMRDATYGNDDALEWLKRRFPV